MQRSFKQRSRVRAEAVHRPQIAVLVPCLNEAVAVGKVIADFRRHLPFATIFVYDNGSSDGTLEIARAAGAVVRVEPMRGKGNVVRRMFADVNAEVFVLVDGDDTYDARETAKLVDFLVENSLDMVSGVRQPSAAEAYRRGHRVGNRLLTELVALFFGKRLSDLLSGCRVLSRRFVKSFPVSASGFEIETELSVHALQLRMPIAELPVQYKERLQGSASKLSTYKDGFKILKTIFYLVQEERPLAFFSTGAAVLGAACLLLGVPVIIEFMQTGLVPRLPTALLAAALAILSFLSFACGLILDTVTRGRIEAKRLSYLSIPLQFEALGSGDTEWEKH
jgi:glycosyltransferase involved in cell wall biosynthesis